ncbi:class I mannose-6-phosphate isomerase [Microbacterium karelineae]|uniref:class I mannose-6-phosphate isomerase n=1 Tax=Microbacterium karelineae TaxID=2654283 RepID=UPI0012EA2DE4|nr:class I mannose-6-phosphate isomerase [Microbacterium karelineae]
MVALPSNRPSARFYRGGQRISAFRGEPRGTGSHEPEDWIASVTSVAGEGDKGRSRLPDGRFLADAVADDPGAWLGDDHTAAFGADTKLLVKLLDAGQRLPVHAHPDARFARERLGHRHGKAEAWWILSPGVVHVGLAERVTAEDLRALVETQRTDEMLALLHEVRVEAGDVVFVPPGTLHAIGEGILLLEAQEPEDLSILLEWNGFDIDGREAGHLGVGFETALGAVDLTVRSRAEIDALIRRPARGESSLPEQALEWFRFDRVAVEGRATIAQGFAILVVADGAATLAPSCGASLEARRGATILLPHAAGEVVDTGAAELIVARPPAP